MESPKDCQMAQHQLQIVALQASGFASRREFGDAAQGKKIAVSTDPDPSRNNARRDRGDEHLECNQLVRYRFASCCRKYSNVCVIASGVATNWRQPNECSFALSNLFPPQAAAVL